METIPSLTEPVVQPHNAWDDAHRMTYWAGLGRLVPIRTIIQMPRWKKRYPS